MAVDISSFPSHLYGFLHSFLQGEVVLGGKFMDTGSSQITPMVDHTSDLCSQSDIPKSQFGFWNNPAEFDSAL